MTFRRLALGLLLAVLFHAPLGLAQEKLSFVDTLQLRVGLVASVAIEGEHTLGFEASLPWFRGRASSDPQWEGFGPVLQYQRLHRHDRTMLGLEYVSASGFGIELGHAMWETDTARIQGIHAAPFFSLLGVVSVGPRVLIPLSQTEGFELGINLYLKVRVFGKYPLGWYSL